MGEIHLPHYALPPGYDAPGYLRKLCYERIGPRYGGKPPEGRDGAAGARARA